MSVGAESSGDVAMPENVELPAATAPAVMGIAMLRLNATFLMGRFISGSWGSTARAFLRFSLLFRFWRYFSLEMLLSKAVVGGIVEGSRWVAAAAMGGGGSWECGGGDPEGRWAGGEGMKGCGLVIAGRFTASGPWLAGGESLAEWTEGLHTCVSQPAPFPRGRSHVSRNSSPSVWAYSRWIACLTSSSKLKVSGATISLPSQTQGEYSFPERVYAIC